MPMRIEKLIDDNTKAIFSETIGNPAGNVCDIEALAKVAHRHGVPLIVDNTVADPDPAQTLRLRRRYRGAFADQVSRRPRHHPRRRIVDSGRFAWTEHASRFAAFNEPDLSYHGLVYTERFGTSAYIQRARSVYQRTMGSVLSPFNAFLLLQGIETVALRVERHVENARKVAEFLRNDRASIGSTTPASPTAPIMRWSRNTSAATPRRCSRSASRAGWKPARLSMMR